MGAVVGGVVLPLARRRLGVPLPIAAAAAVTAPFGMAVAMPRTRARDAAVYGLQMWAYVVAHEVPNEDPARLERRALVDYPIRFDRAVFRCAPTVVLQRALGRPGRTTAFDHALVYAHWAWFVQPHLAAAWILWRHPRRFPRAATMICAVFDIGLIGYFAVPTAPPWWAAEQGRIPGMRRIMAEVGERVWGRFWSPLYGFLGGNPLAAMPSLHFATSVMAARMLAETGRVAGAAGWTYAAVLGFALIYLGEHYVVDLAAGAVLAESVRRLGPQFAPALEAGVRTLARSAA
jgi:membrane-associated phospholipid phosphatase